MPVFVQSDRAYGHATETHTALGKPNGTTKDGHGFNNQSRSSLSDKRTDEQTLRPHVKRTGLAVTAIVASAVALLLCAKSILFPSQSTDGIKKDQGHASSTGQSQKYSERRSKNIFDERGRYILEDFDSKPAFSDFLPGVAGTYGIPVWSFYINRGQGIASFGIKSKNFPMMEFNSANKAYQNTAMLGFRTFIQGTRGSHSFSAEPFSPLETRYEEFQDKFDSLPKRVMYVGTSDVQIQEVDSVNKIETNVSYFTLPEEDFGAFVRRTTITNLGKESLSLSLLDGLARIEPAGGKLNEMLKNIGRTLEGWFGVYQAHEDSITMPFYRMSTEATDTAAVKIQQEGYYCLSFIEDSDVLLPIVYDPSKVFGEDTMMQRPIRLQKASSVTDIVNSAFMTLSILFCRVEL